MSIAVAIAVLGLVLGTAVVSPKLFRAKPTAFLAVTFFVSLLVSSDEPLGVYVRMAAALLSVLLLIAGLRNRRSLLRDMRLELILLVASIVAIFVSVVLPEAFRPAGTMIAIVLVASFIVMGAIRVNLALINAKRHRARVD